MDAVLESIRCNGSDGFSGIVNYDAGDDSVSMRGRIEGTVFVIEPDPGSNRSLAWIFRSAGLDVYEYRSGEDFLDSFDGDPAGCLLVNLELPGMSGVAVLEELARRGVTMPVILFTGYGKGMVAVEAFRSGAFDVVDKAFDLAVVERVRQALSIDARRRQRRMAKVELRARLERLTPREREVADLVVSGNANKVIAYDLEISERTVECHRSHIMRKLGVKTAAEVVRIVVLAKEAEAELRDDIE